MFELWGCENDGTKQTINKPRIGEQITRENVVLKQNGADAVSTEDGEWLGLLDGHCLKLSRSIKSEVAGHVPLQRLQLWRFAGFL